MNEKIELGNAILEDYKNGMSITDLCIKYNLSDDQIRYYINKDTKDRIKNWMREHYNFPIFRKLHIKRVMLSRVKRDIAKFEDELQVSHLVIKDKLKLLEGVTDKGELKWKIRDIIKSLEGSSRFMNGKRIKKEYVIKFIKFMNKVERLEQLKGDIEELENQMKQIKSGTTKSISEILEEINNVPNKR